MWHLFKNADIFWENIYRQNDPTYFSMHIINCFQDGASGKILSVNSGDQGDTGSIPESRRFPGSRKWWSSLFSPGNSPDKPWGCKEIKPVNPKGNQPRTLIGWTDAEAEARIIWPHDEKSQLTGKDPYAGKDWGQEEKRMSEDEMVAWYYRLSRHEFLQTRGDCEGLGSLACYSL